MFTYSGESRLTGIYARNDILKSDTRNPTPDTSPSHAHRHAISSQNHARSLALPPYLTNRKGACGPGAKRALYARKRRESSIPESEVSCVNLRSRVRAEPA